MTDQTPVDGFEKEVTALVRSYTERAAKPIDPVLTARTAMASGTRSGVLGRLWPLGHDRRVAWLFILGALVITIAAFALAVGSRPSLVFQAPDGPARITFVRDGDLFIAEIDGSGKSLIASGDAGDAKFGYLTAAWSPDRRHIAAVRDVGGEFLTPGVDLMTADGALVRTVALEPGCGPSVSWSPDSTEVAIATCPADVPRDTIEPVDSGIGLRIAGLDASADRDLALPSEWRSVASASREVWIRPELWARWSPDGRWIAVPAESHGHQLFGHQLVAADGSGTRPIEKFTETLYDVDSFDWSPDGHSLAISGNVLGCAGQVCLGIVASEGGPVTSVGHPSGGDPNMHGKLFWPEFSPDGARVAVIGGLLDTSEPDPPDTNTLYSYDLATGSFTELTSGTRQLVFDATGAATPTGVVTGELVEWGSVAWTPDGGKLLYLVRDAGDGPATWTLRSIDAAGGSESTVLVSGVQAFDVGGPRP